MRSSALHNKNAPKPVQPAIWYLVNLLLLPLIGFAVLLVLYFKSASADAIYRAHAKAAVYMSVIGAVLIGGVVGALYGIYGNSGEFWSMGLVWAIVLHTSFVLWGMVSLARAMNHQPPDFPGLKG